MEVLKDDFYVQIDYSADDIIIQLSARPNIETIKL